MERCKKFRNLLTCQIICPTIGQTNNSIILCVVRTPECARSKNSRRDPRSPCRVPIGSVRTPFDRSGAIDFRALRRMVDFLVDAGSPAVMLTYGDSLYSVLTDREVEEVTRVVAEQTAGRALVIAADRGWWTGKAAEFGDFGA